MKRKIVKERSEEKNMKRNDKPEIPFQKMVDFIGFFILLYIS